MSCCSSQFSFQDSEPVGGFWIEELMRREGLSSREGIGLCITPVLKSLQHPVYLKGHGKD